MRGWFDRVSYRSDTNAHTEPAQGLIRCLALLVLLGLISGLLVWGHVEPAYDQPIQLLRALLVADGVFCLALFVWMLIDTRPRTVRRAMAVANDHIVLGLMLALGGPYTSPAYMFLLWTTFGSGLRYGTNWLKWLTPAAVVVFLVAAWINPFWSAQPLLVGSLAAVLILVPIYTFIMQSSAAKAYQAAQHEVHEREEILVGVTTQVQTPLRGIVELSNLLMGRLSSADDRELAQLIVSAAEETLPFVAGTLDRMRGEQGKYQAEEKDFSVTELMSRIHTIMRAPAAQRRVRFQVRKDPDVPDALKGDAVRWMEALVCLLHSVLEQTEEGSVVFSAGWVRSDDATHTVAFTLRDTSGMQPDDAIQLLFHADRSTGSSYSLASRLAVPLLRQLGAEIAVTRNGTLGICTSITMAFPRAAARPAATSLDMEPRLRANADAHRREVPPLRILVGEMHPTAFWMIQRLLTVAGHHTAPTRIIGSESAGQPMGLMLVDLDVTEPPPEALLAQAQTLDLPVIALTTTVPHTPTVAPIVHVILKPVDPYELLAAIEEIALPRLADGHLHVDAHQASAAPTTNTLLARVHLAVMEGDPAAMTHLATLMASLPPADRQGLRAVGESFSAIGQNAPRAERVAWLGRLRTRMEDLGLT